MKTNFLHNRKKQLIWLSVFAALFLTLIIFKDSASHIVSRPLMAVARPFLQINNLIGNWWQKNIFIIEEKKSLKTENIGLKERIFELEAKMPAYEILEKENEQLKEMLSRSGENKYSFASVLMRPPQSPYDILIIDAGSKDGIKNGMQATAYGDILLGYVSEVFPKTSKIKLISFPREENNVMIIPSGRLPALPTGQEGGRQVSAIAIGRGGENLEITLPRVIEINSGERIATLGINPLLVGIAEKIQIDPADPFQKILFRLPINIQELKYVMIKL